MSSHIPFDIQVQIIERLPIKSLIRFRSVCKAWKSFIDCSEFIAAYSFRHTQSQHLMIRYEVGYREEKEVKYVCFVDDDNDNDSFPQQKFALTVPPLVQLTKTVIGSSHGLLCLSGYFGEPDDSCPTSRTKMVVLWNPSIRKSIAVVVPLSNVVHLPFNYVIGFGVCPDTNDSKLVKITYIDDQTEMESISCIPCQVMVFTLSSGEWTTSCSNKLPRKSIEFTCYQTVIGQFIYWHAYDWIDENGACRNLIMSFNMSTEEFTEIDLPDCLVYAWDSNISISMLRESLAVVEYHEVCDVWMMEDGDSKAFTKLFTINSSVLSTLGFRKSGEPIFEMRGELAVYEPCLEHIKELGIRGNRCSFFTSSYTESLLLLDHDDGHIVNCAAVKRLVGYTDGFLFKVKLFRHMQSDCFEHLCSRTDLD